jgi:glycosyltransferase involved in cell wall biosynthesis
MHVDDALATAGAPTPRRIRVLFIIGTLDVGGSETQLAELAARLDRASFEVTVCVMKTGGALAAPLAARGVRVETLGFTSARQVPWRQRPRAVFDAWRGIVRLWRLLRRERPDVVHGFLVPAYLLATFVGRLAGIRTIVSSRRSLGLFKEKKTVYLFFERIADRMTDLFIANSEAVRADTLRREPVSPSQIIVIHNGLDFERLDLAAPAADLPSDSRPRVIVVSNLIRYKGHEFFLRAWRDVVRRVPGATALLAGDGPMRGMLESMCRELGIEQTVTFLGVRSDVPSLLAASDLYVHPSLQEGYSNALLEAMAAGLPVIATAVGGNVEAVEDGVTGCLVPAEDAAALAAAMIRLLSEKSGAKAIGSRARAAVRARHGLADGVRSYEAVYRRLVMPAATGDAMRDRAASATAHAGADR